MPVSVSYTHLDVYKRQVSEFSVLAPFGKDNPKPVFADKNLRVSRMWVVAVSYTHLDVYKRQRKGCPDECKGPNEACPPYTPDFLKLVDSYGGPGIRV